MNKKGNKKNIRFLTIIDISKMGDFSSKTRTPKWGPKMVQIPDFLTPPTPPKNGQKMVKKRSKNGQKMVKN